MDLQHCACCDAVLPDDDAAMVGSDGAVQIYVCEPCFEQCHTWVHGTAWDDGDYEDRCAITGILERI